MPPLPRGTCPICGRDVALRIGGRLREHDPKNIELQDQSYWGNVCAGSGMFASELYDPALARLGTHFVGDDCPGGHRDDPHVGDPA